MSEFVKIPRDDLRKVLLGKGEDESLPLCQRVEEVLTRWGSEQFEEAALIVRGFKVTEGKSPDAARKLLARAWRKAQPREPMPSLPRYFLSRRRAPVQDFRLRTQSAGVVAFAKLPNGRLVMGSISSLRNYLTEGGPNDWARLDLKDDKANPQ